MAESDRILENLYVLADRQPDERKRLEVVRIALIAAKHRAAQLKDAGTPAPRSRAGVASVTRPATGE